MKELSGPTLISTLQRTGSSLRSSRPLSVSVRRHSLSEEDRMQITVCEFPNEASRHEAAWTELVRFLQARPTDVVVLPEMPFCDWRMFMTKTIDPAVWEAALAAHDATIARFAALQTTLVLASRPVQINGKRVPSTISRTNPMAGRLLGLREGTASLPPSL